MATVEDSAVKKHVGVLGGGQLGRMMAEAAHRLGIKLTVLDPSDPSPAAQVCGSQVVGDFKDAAKIVELAGKGCDVLTCEIEHVDADALAAAGVEAQPHPRTLAVVQDKFAQKELMRSKEVPLGDYASVSSESDVAEYGSRWGYPLMLKSRRFAYDGKGNAVVGSESAISGAAEALGGFGDGGGTLYVERWVSFRKELAVMVVRGRDGELRAYDCVETEQEESVCRRVIAPARVPVGVRAEAMGVALRAVGALEGAGMYGVELFWTAERGVLYNEVAPRPHNAGHYTIEACECDQFENHLRAILGLPLGSTALRVGAAVMVNALGTGSDREAEQETWRYPCGAGLAVPGAAVHWYGKAGVRKGRKVGHVTVTADSMPEALSRAALLDPPTTSSSSSSFKPTVGARVAVIMGSDSDLPSMKACCETLESFAVPFSVSIVSAHRTSDYMLDFAKSARSNGIEVIVAAAGGAAHLPGMVAAATPLPVIGVPVPLRHLDGVDSLHSIVQMPRGVPVATVAIGNSTNAALLAIRILSVKTPKLADAMEKYQQDMQDTVRDKDRKLESIGWKDYLDSM